MNKSRTSNRKPRKSKPTQNNHQNGSGARDECHSTNSPACALAKQVTVDILPEASEALKLTVKQQQQQQQNGSRSPTSAVVAPPTMLGRLLRQHLLTEFKSSRIDQSSSSLSNAPTGPPPPSKKKRKKKKKKGKTANGVAQEGGESSSQASASMSSMTATDERKGGAGSLTGDNGTAAASSQQPTSKLQQQTEAAKPTIEEETTTMTTSRRSASSSPARRKVMHWMEKIVNHAASDLDGTPATPPPNRTLDSFLSFLATATSVTPPTVCLQEVMFHIKDVVCVPCRTAVEAYWSGTGIPPNEVGIISGSPAERPYALYPALLDPPQSTCKTTIPTVGVDSSPDWGIALADDTDRAFDYRAMEEGEVEHGGGGQVGVPPDAFCLYSVIDGETTKPIALEMRHTNTKKNNGSTKVAPSHSTPIMDTVGIERLVRDMILPCGLPEVEAPNARVLSNDEFQTVVRRVKSKEEPILKQLQQLQQQKDQQLDAVRELVEKAGSTKPTDQCNVKTTTDLLDSDKGCGQLLDGILTLLLQLTGIFQGLRGGSCATDGDWALRTMQALWRSYSECVESLLESLLTHEGKLFQLANPPGALPQMFLNLSHRSSYMELVQRKLDAIAELCTNVLVILTDDLKENDTMMSSSSYSTTFLRKLLTKEAFVAVIVPSNNDNNNTASKLDETCRTLLRSYNELTEPAQNCLRINHVLDTQEQRCLSLATQLGSVNELIVEEFRCTLEERLHNLDTTLWNDLRRQYRQVSSERYEPPEPDEWDDGQEEVDRSAKAGSLASDRKRLAKLTSIAASQWLCMRSMQACCGTSSKQQQPDVNDNSMAFPEMPLRLKKWMSINRESESNNNKNQACQGSQPQRRLACILSCLLYKWLQERCEEWHSELTQKELLDSEDGVITSTRATTAIPTTTVDAAAGTTTSSTKARSSKNSRRKRKKKAAAAATVVQKNGQERPATIDNATIHIAPTKSSQTKKQQQDGSRNGQVDGGSDNKFAESDNTADGWVTVGGDGGGKMTKNGKKTAAREEKEQRSTTTTAAVAVAVATTTRKRQTSSEQNRAIEGEERKLREEPLSDDESGCVGVEETKEEPPDEYDPILLTKDTTKTTEPMTSPTHPSKNLSPSTRPSTIVVDSAKTSPVVEPKKKTKQRRKPETKQDAKSSDEALRFPKPQESRASEEDKMSSSGTVKDEKKEESQTHETEPVANTTRDEPKKPTAKSAKEASNAGSTTTMEKTKRSRSKEDKPSKKGEPSTVKLTLRTRRGGKVSAEEFLVRRFREVAKSKGVVFL